jgi:hypothetical protein
MNGSHGVLVRVALMGIAAVAWWRDLSHRRGFGLAVITTLLCILAALLWRRWEQHSAERAVRTLPIPSFLRERLRLVYPHLDDAATRQVERGLRQFFGANARARGDFVAMPSKVVDALWHEFILHTRSYEVFCQRAFGRMLHHTPAEAVDGLSTAVARGSTHAPRGRNSVSPSQRLAGLRRAWNWSCHDEGIDPRRPNTLPLLFALDTRLAIPDGYRYVPDCRLLGEDRGTTHCGSDLGGGSSGDSGSPDGGSDGGGGDAGSDGGGGCGGGGD